MAFNDELLRAEVYREFGIAADMGEREAFGFDQDEDGFASGFHITDGDEERSAKSKRNSRLHVETMKDPVKAERRRRQKRESAARAYQRSKQITGVVMDDGSKWSVQ